MLLTHLFPDWALNRHDLRVQCVLCVLRLAQPDNRLQCRKVFWWLLLKPYNLAY